jgi:hypothetical protein
MARLDTARVTTVIITSRRRPAFVVMTTNGIAVRATTTA